MIKSLQSRLRRSVRMSARGNQSCFLVPVSAHTHIYTHTHTHKKKDAWRERCSIPKSSELPP